MNLFKIFRFLLPQAIATIAAFANQVPEQFRSLFHLIVEFLKRVVDIKLDKDPDDKTQLEQLWREKRKDFAFEGLHISSQYLEELIDEKVKDDTVKQLLLAQINTLQLSIQELSNDNPDFERLFKEQMEGAQLLSWTVDVPDSDKKKA